MSVRGGWGVYYVSCSKGTCGSLLHRAHREEKKQKGVGERGRGRSIPSKIRHLTHQVSSTTVLVPCEVADLSLAGSFHLQYNSFLPHTGDHAIPQTLLFYQ